MQFSEWWERNWDKIPAATNKDAAQFVWNAAKRFLRNAPKQAVKADAKIRRCPTCGKNFEDLGICRECDY